MAEPAAARSLEERVKTAKVAREMFVSNVPDILVTLVGTTAAKNGAKKVFDTLQNKVMNKQLFYVSFFLMCCLFFHSREDTCFVHCKLKKKG